MVNNRVLIDSRHIFASCRLGPRFLMGLAADDRMERWSCIRLSTWGWLNLAGAHFQASSIPAEDLAVSLILLRRKLKRPGWFLLKKTIRSVNANTGCYAWALIPNHFHLLFRTGQVPIATVMRRLLTGHAGYYNKRHRRSGHLFQNRYKSILCQEDAYLLELVRYIHLNPLRARLVQDYNHLRKYPYCGHSALLGEVKRAWQDTEWVLRLYCARVSEARRLYHAFVENGISMGRRKDLTGGGLIRSMGGWAAVISMRKAKVFEKSDERILGDGNFVDHALAMAEEQLERRNILISKGYSLEKIADHVSAVMEIDPSEVWKSGKSRRRVAARGLLCFWAVRELGISMTDMARRLNLSLSAVSPSIIRGEKIADESGFALLEKKL